MLTQSILITKPLDYVPSHHPTQHSRINHPVLFKIQIRTSQSVPKHHNSYLRRLQTLQPTISFQTSITCLPRTSHRINHYKLQLAAQTPNIKPTTHKLNQTQQCHPLTTQILAEILPASTSTSTSQASQSWQRNSTPSLRKNRHLRRRCTSFSNPRSPPRTQCRISTP